MSSSGVSPARGGIGFSWRHWRAIGSLDLGGGVELVRMHWRGKALTRVSGTPAGVPGAAGMCWAWACAGHDRFSLAVAAAALPVVWTTWFLYPAPGITCLSGLSTPVVGKGPHGLASCCHSLEMSHSFEQEACVFILPGASPILWLVPHTSHFTEVFTEDPSASETCQVSICASLRPPFTLALRSVPT